MFAIIGGGFALYGYLPAVMKVHSGAILLDKHREKILARPELAPYADRIEWRPAAGLMLKDATGAIIAVPPEGQRPLVYHVAATPSVKQVVLEKPIAPTVGAAEYLLKHLTERGRQVRVGYTFLDQPWMDDLRKAVATEQRIKLTWMFKAHHFANNLQTWKSDPAFGGGPLKFYGIHFLAVAASLGYTECENSRLGVFVGYVPSDWSATLTGPGLPPLEVNVMSVVNRNEFSIVGDSEKVIFSADGPIASGGSRGVEDARVPTLERLLRCFDQPDDPYITLYNDTNTLWRRVEEALKP